MIVTYIKTKEEFIMTNTMIILNESVKLMEEGILEGVGPVSTIVVLDSEGNEIEKELQMPEEIHTFAGWKKLGFKVKKGEHSIAQFPIWKYTSKKILDDAKKVVLDENGDEMVKENMFMKMSYFFKKSQVEELK